MTRGEWNGLRAGDVVFVHEPWVRPAAALRGSVGSVDMRGRRGNGVGIHLDAGGVVWPSWLASHKQLVDAECWRCDELAAQSG